MLHELKNTRQIPGEGFRRWFTDADLDLVVWYQDETMAEISGFQLSYDKKNSQHALTWTARGGFQLNRVDDGEAAFGAKMSPVLMSPAGFDSEKIEVSFTAAAGQLEHGIASLVCERIGEYGRRFQRSGDESMASIPHPGLLGQVMLDELRDAFYGPSFHGPSLYPALSSLTVEQVLWQGIDEGRPIGAWQIALHCAYWKHFTTLVLHEHLDLGELKPLHRFELSDWGAGLPPRNQVESDWQDCLASLKLEHEAMIQAVAILVIKKPQSLGLVEAKSGRTWAQLVYGMAAHDVYHTAHLRNIGIPGLKD